MPQLVSLFLRNYAIGFLLAVVFTRPLLALDLGGLRHLVLNVQGGFLAGFLLFFFSGLVFAGAQTGIAVFLMAERDAPRPPRPPRAPVADPLEALATVPVPVPVADAGRQRPGVTRP